jgi:hypothetical protein
VPISAYRSEFIDENSINIKSRSDISSPKKAILSFEVFEVFGFGFGS